jgi:putative transposase
MKKTRFSEAKIVEILKEYAATGKTAEICRRLGIHPNTLRNWKAKYGGLEVSDVVKMKQLEEENSRLKRIVANQAMDGVTPAGAGHRISESFRRKVSNGKATATSREREVRAVDGAA